jgi:hypothetical protein
VAIPYYIFNIRMTVTLEDPVYFNKDAWIALIKQVCGWWWYFYLSHAFILYLVFYQQKRFYNKRTNST